MICPAWDIHFTWLTKAEESLLCHPEWIESLEELIKELEFNKGIPKAHYKTIYPGYSSFIAGVQGPANQQFENCEVPQQCANFQGIVRKLQCQGLWGQQVNVGQGMWTLGWSIWIEVKSNSVIWWRAWTLLYRDDVLSTPA